MQIERLSLNLLSSSSSQGQCFNSLDDMFLQAYLSSTVSAIEVFKIKEESFMFKVLF